MIITTNPTNIFQTDFSQYDLVGFHGTFVLAAGDIEKYGLLPKKVFTDVEHDAVRVLGKKLSIDTGSYVKWLCMLSVSFGGDAPSAISQMSRDFVGGQGLYNMENVLKETLRRGDTVQQAFAQTYLNQIDVIRKSPVVVYAVDLSGWKHRVVKEHSGTLQFYFNPAEPIPEYSLIDPSLIIERLDLTQIAV